MKMKLPNQTIFPPHSIFPECPVHNHHTDNDSVCPDDPPCFMHV